MPGESIPTNDELYAIQCLFYQIPNPEAIDQLIALGRSSRTLQYFVKYLARRFIFYRQDLSKYYYFILRGVFLSDQPVFSEELLEQIINDLLNKPIDEQHQKSGYQMVFQHLYPKVSEDSQRRITKLRRSYDAGEYEGSEEDLERSIQALRLSDVFTGSAPTNLFLHACAVGHIEYALSISAGVEDKFLVHPSVIVRFFNPHIVDDFEMYIRRRDVAMLADPQVIAKYQHQLTRDEIANYSAIILPNACITNEYHPPAPTVEFMSEMDQIVSICMSLSHRELPASKAPTPYAKRAVYNYITELTEFSPTHVDICVEYLQKIEGERPLKTQLSTFRDYTMYDPQHDHLPDNPYIRHAFGVEISGDMLMCLLPYVENDTTDDVRLDHRSVGSYGRVFFEDDLPEFLTIYGKNSGRNVVWNPLIHLSVFDVGLIFGSFKICNWLLMTESITFSDYSLLFALLGNNLSLTKLVLEDFMTRQKYAAITRAVSLTYNQQVFEWLLENNLREFTTSSTMPKEWVERLVEEYPTDHVLRPKYYLEQFYYLPFADRVVRVTKLGI